MLCFLHGFNEGHEKSSSKDQKNLRFRLLRKSRSSANLEIITTGNNMVVPSRSHHCRTQSAIPSNTADISGASRAVHTLAGSASSASLLQVHRSPSHIGVFTKMDK
ncbi:hypothetical protein WA026_003730 [Henosepilachna vigintioctopunctata]|uniref:Uncharacterized protein n=1 Tax=Henosepilachna vigintioctopunctata TaxID=420089 RepID=A0AAW1UE86_9CUCU